MKPLRLKNYLSDRDIIKLLPMSRVTFYRWVVVGKFGNLVKSVKKVFC
ncbi:MAG: hypothetical protein ABIF11_06940 [Nitrospirota bacterium]